MTKLERAVKTVGEETLKELHSMDSAELKQRIVTAEESMHQVAQELDDNEKYQELKANISAMGAGKREVDKRQKAIILLALSLLNESGAAK